MTAVCFAGQKLQANESCPPGSLPLQLVRQGHKRAACFAALALFASPAFAASTMPTAPLANVQLADPVQEAQAKALMETLRCLVCQGQAIADSNADLAADMRSLVRQRIRDGETPDQVRAWLVKRYGAWVSYEPPLGADTVILWIAPVLLLVAGALLALGSLRRRRR